MHAKCNVSSDTASVWLYSKYGGKQLYYNNTFDGQGEIDINKDTSNGVIDTEEPVTNTDFIDDDDCESCKI